MIFVKYIVQLESRQQKRKETGKIYDPFNLLDMESNSEWIIEKGLLSENCTWMKTFEFLEVIGGTNGSKVVIIKI